MTEDNHDRLTHIETRLDGIENEQREIKLEQREIKLEQREIKQLLGQVLQMLARIDGRLDEQRQTINAIIPVRIAAIPGRTAAE